MTDIVDELRQKSGGHRRLRMLAADEIERLRKIETAGQKWRKANFGPDPTTNSYRNTCEDELLFALDAVGGGQET